MSTDKARIGAGGCRDVCGVRATGETAERLSAQRSAVGRHVALCYLASLCRQRDGALGDAPVGGLQVGVVTLAGDGDGIGAGGRSTGGSANGILGVGCHCRGAATVCVGHAADADALR